MPVRIKRSAPPRPPAVAEWKRGYRFKARTDTNTYDFELVSEESMIAVMVESKLRPWFVEADKRHVRLAASNVRAEIL